MPTVTDQYPGKSKVKTTDEQAKAAAIKQYEETKAQEHKFPTEIIDLPSKGLLYEKDNPLSQGQVEMKYMTAREEDILTSQSYIKQGVVLDKLFRALIIGNGKGEKVNYSDILTGDKNAIMIAARVLGYGKDYEITITTPSGEKQKETIDLTSFEHTQFDESSITTGVNEFEFTLPATKRLIKFKILNSRDGTNIDNELKGLKKINKGGADSSLTTRMIHCIVSVDGNDSRSYVRNFVNNEFLAIDSRAFRSEMAKVQPDINLSVTLIDNQTDEPFDIDLPINIDFFWPRA